MNDTRRILYVDASYSRHTKEAKISLYDKEANKLDTLFLQNIISATEAEKYAILNACVYIKRKNIIDRKVHILTDNQSASHDEAILDIGKYVNATISWIPREINLIADKGTRLDVNRKEEESRLLEFFYDMVKCKTLPLPIPNEAKKKEIKEEIKEIPKKVNSIPIDSTREILIYSFNAFELRENESVNLSHLGKYIKKNYPEFKYKSLKKAFLKYPDDFTVNKDSIGFN